MKKIFEKYREIIMYVIFGVGTTIVNYVVFLIFEKFIPINYQLANLIAFIASVIFAYITNKLYVFDSKSWNFKVVSREISTFTAARIFSYFIDVIIMFIGVTLMGKNSLIVKLIDNVVVVIINYVLSKLVIFKK